MPISETPFEDLVLGKEGAEQHFDQPQYANNIFQRAGTTPIQTKVDTLAQLVYSWRALKQGEIDAWNEIEHLRGKIDELKDAATLHNYTLESGLSATPAEGINQTAQRPKQVHRGLRLLSGFDDTEITELT